MQPSTTHVKKLNEWDTLYSTYWFTIHLDKTHPRNTVPAITGHSKKTDQRENADRISLLQKVIYRLHRAGYFERMMYMQIHQRTRPMIDKQRDPCILLLYPDHYDIPTANPNNHQIMLKQQGVFLNNFYTGIREGTDLSKLITGRKPKTHSDFLNVLVWFNKIRNVAELYHHAGSCLINGHAQGEVDHFILKFKEAKKWP